MGGFGVAQIVVFIGFLELFVMKQKEGSFPGDMSRINPFEKQWESFSEETKLQKRAIELNNGRAAQMGIFGMVVHEIMSNQPYIINDILGEKWLACLPRFYIHHAAVLNPLATTKSRWFEVYGSCCVCVVALTAKFCAQNCRLCSKYLKWSKSSSYSPTPETHVFHFSGTSYTWP